MCVRPSAVRHVGLCLRERLKKLLSHHAASAHPTTRQCPPDETVNWIMTRPVRDGFFRAVDLDDDTARRAITIS